MGSVSVRDLRNHGGEVLTRVEQGEAVFVTRDGTPVAELRPLRRTGPPAAGLNARWRTLPPVDLDALRSDIDALLNADL
jgi:prevent-host-death family protein